MQISVFAEPRSFVVGHGHTNLSHVANIALKPNEVITFLGESDEELDFTAKDWGYYVTPSVGSRLRRFGMRAALMRNIDTRHLFVVVVLDRRMSAFHAYMEAERQELVLWLDESG